MPRGSLLEMEQELVDTAMRAVGSYGDISGAIYDSDFDDNENCKLITYKETRR